MKTIPIMLIMEPEAFLFVTPGINSNVFMRIWGTTRSMRHKLIESIMRTDTVKIIVDGFPVRKILEIEERQKPIQLIKEEWFNVN